MKKRILSWLLVCAMAVAVFAAIPAVAADSYTQEDITKLLSENTAGQLHEKWNARSRTERKTLVYSIEEELSPVNNGDSSAYKAYLEDKGGMIDGFVAPADFTDAQLTAAIALMKDAYKLNPTAENKALLEKFLKSDYNGKPFVAQFSKDHQQKIAKELSYLDLGITIEDPPVSPSPSQKPTDPTPSQKPTDPTDPTPSAPVVLDNPFEDVAKGKFYYDAVLWAVNHDPQITKGVSATSFAPNDGCTRGQVVTFLWRAKGMPEPSNSESPFTDVTNPKSFYYKAVLWAVEQGITKGMTETTFAPDETCTRGQIATFLYRFHGSPDAADSNPFADVSAGSFYYKAVLWAVKQGITNGTSETTFEPDSVCTRGHIVTFLYRDDQGK